MASGLRAAEITTMNEGGRGREKLNQRKQGER